MSIEAEEANETQQLMHNEGVEEEEPKILKATASPVISTKISSGGASSSSKNVGIHVTSSGNNSFHESSKVSYVNERRLHRELAKSSSKPKNIPKDAPDVKHMEKALLELLNDFHTGKLSAFGEGCTMDQMINIRDQQEHLAKLHFRLCADPEKLDEESDNSVSRDKMTQLVHSLEQLSTSIENLHSGNKNKEPEKT